MVSKYTKKRVSRSYHDNINKNKIINVSTNDINVDIKLNWNNKPVLVDITEDVYKNIEEEIDKFEKYKYTKNFININI